MDWKRERRAKSFPFIVRELGLLIRAYMVGGLALPMCILLGICGNGGAQLGTPPTPI